MIGIAGLAGRKGIEVEITGHRRCLPSSLKGAHLQLMKALRVLVIEDDALITMLLSELLAGMGHEVCATAATEAEAVGAATRYDLDPMIVDAGLGPGSGVSAVEEILRAGPLAHVFVSGDADRLRVLKPDAVVVRKPFREAELAKAIDTALAATPAAVRKSERLGRSRDSH